MMSPDLTAQNIDKIAELFPAVVTEVAVTDELGNQLRDDAGNLLLRKAIDFDLLKQELSSTVVEGPVERYQLDWPGKRESLLAANAPIAKTLRPVPEESVDFESTENLFIEGDNLEALKLLQESYLGKVKMIYIDPPYNTGNDFVYNDDFAEDAEEYLERSLQKDENGDRLVSNTESNGRFHSDWLSMMHSRLRLARNLLTDDGVIFVSIDDNEQASLKLLCDEVFGEQNFIANFIWQRRVSSALSDNNVSIDHENVLCYHKGGFTNFQGVEKDFKNYKNPDNDPRGPWIADNLTVGMNESMRPNQAYTLVDPKTGREFKHNPNRVWAYIPESMNKLIDEGRVIFPNNENQRPMLKRFQFELKSKHNPVSSIIIDKVSLNTSATRLLQKIFDANFFNYSKPIDLIDFFIKQITQKNDIVLDFFAGSSTTAHAVMQLNAEDGGNRKFIMVQLPEKVDEKHQAYNAGYQTIAEISKERIRRAGKQILESDEIHEDWNRDIGFRVLKVDSSNMKEVYYQPQELTQADLLDQVDNVKEDRTPEDLLFQVMLDWGLELSLPITTEEIEGKKVFFVADDALIACFDAGITESLVQTLAAKEPLRLLFRDNHYLDNDTKINAEQLVKQIAPNTELKSI